MRVLFLDFETSDENPKTANITEIGASLRPWDKTDPKGILTPIQEYSTLVYETSYPPQSKLIEEITGIGDQMLKESGRDNKTALTRLGSLIEESDLIVAHNAKFDRTVWETNAKKYGIPDYQKEWLCTLNDFPWPSRYTCKKLGHLAMDHGLKMDDRKLHRALDDVNLLIELIFTKYDFEKVLEYSREPWCFVKADVLGPWQDGGTGRDQAKKCKYGWEKVWGMDEPVFPKTWVKRIKVSQIEEEKRACPFRVVEL